MKYKIAICDDEPQQTAYLSSLAEGFAAESGNAAAVSAFPSAEAFLFDYAENKDYDILLLDIEMKEVNGVELAKRVRAENSTVQIVFVTGYPDFIAEGYEVGALHYLMKPVKKEKLYEVLGRAVQSLGKSERAILFAIGGENVRVSEGDIVFVEAFAHSVVVHTSERALEVKMSISECEKLLGEGFVRCHRSYVAGLKYISRITKNTVILDSGDEIPLSRSSFQAVNRAFVDYYTGGVR